MRPGEAAALRWRHYDPTVTPLGEILVVKSYNMRGNVEKMTKTDAVKHIPVHPVQAAMLAQWKLEGWPEMMGRGPGPDDLIVPLPPDAARRRRARHGEPHRSNDYSGTRWRDKDLRALGWWHRRHYDMRATFITRAIEDGADPDVIETRVTHTRKARNVFDGYNRGLHWERTCSEILKPGSRADHNLGDRATAPGRRRASVAAVAASGGYPENQGPLGVQPDGTSVVTASHDTASPPASEPPGDVLCQGLVPRR